MRAHCLTALPRAKLYCTAAGQSKESSSDDVAPALHPPLSSAVGGIIGFALVYGGGGAVQWATPGERVAGHRSLIARCKLVPPPVPC